MIQFDQEHVADILNAYFHTYIKEEIKEEGAVRNLPPFMRFLNVAGQLNGQAVNALNISRDAAVPRSSVDHYFSILFDTLLAHLLPAYQPNLKVRERTHPKFYWFDAGVARAAAGLLFDPLDRLWKGCASKLLSIMNYEFITKRKKHRPVAYYRTAAGSEIDFVIEIRKRQQGSRPHIVCLEVKLAEKWDRK